ncbi:MAG: PAS domain S-box protein [Candidatus Omnitrophica bacterium]|nr:PAS domain S-box protein [Candidatus Omnitrophota bacterium]
MPDGKKQKILLVENNTMFACQMIDMINGGNQSSFDILHVQNLTRAFDELERDVFDIVLLDLMLPESRGLDTFTVVAAKIKDKGTPIMILTGLEDISTALDAVKLGAKDYLIKGQFLSNLLIRAIYSSIERNEIERSLLQSRNELQGLVRDRTGDLMNMHERFQLEIEKCDHFEVELKRVNRAFQLVLECNEIIIHAKNEAEMLAEICSRIVNVGGYLATWVGFTGATNEKEIILFVQIGVEKGYVENLGIPHPENEPESEISSRVIDKCEIVVINDYESDAQLGARLKDCANRMGIKSGIGLPLFIEERLIGVLCFYSGEKNIFDFEEVDLLSLMAQDIAYGISLMRSREQNKKTEERLIASEKKYRQLVESLQEGIWVIDNGSKTTFVNAKMAEMLGYSAEEMLGKSFFSFFDEDAAGKAKNTMGNRPLGLREKYDFELIRKDGSRLCAIMKVGPLIDEGGMYMGAIAGVIDITERKKAEEELRSSEQRLKILFDFAPDAYFLTDLNGIFFDCNGSAERLLGYTKEDLIGKNLEELKLLSSEHCAKLINLFERNLRGESVFPTEITILMKDGSRLVLEVGAFPVRIKGQNLMLVISRDVTEYKRLEISQRLAQLGELVADIMHEINNPLMVISGRTQLSLMEDIPDENLKNNLKIIFQEVQNMRVIIQSLLKFSKPSKGVLKEVDVNKTLEEVIILIEHQFNIRGIEIVRGYSKSLPVISMDEKHLQEVFMNMLTNAFDAIGKNGRIDVLTSSDTAFVYIELRDTGAGIPVNVMEKLFTPFFTTKEKGTGLGLAVSYSIIRSYGGEIKFKSEEGEGTSVTITVPVKNG